MIGNSVKINLFTKKIAPVIFGNIYIFLLLSLFLFSCDRLNFSRSHVATVNGAKIYLDEYQFKLNQEMAKLPKDISENEHLYISRLEEEVLDSMITEKIMELRAKELNISVSSSELENKINEVKRDYGEDFVNLLAQQNIRYSQWKKEIEKEILIQKLIAVDVNSQIRVSDDQAEDYYNDRRNNYKLEPHVKVAQIVVRNVDTAEKILAQLNAGEDFAALAKKYSISPEASMGGDLGYITKDTMPEPLDDVIFELPLNKVSRIVQSQYGFHIFRVSDIQKGRIKSFAEVKEEVIAEIRTLKEEVAFVSWLNSLRLNAIVKKESTVLRKKVNREK